MINPSDLERLRQFSGPAIANAIETFGVRLRNEGFADGSLRCMSLELEPAVGYAITVRIRSSAPPPVGHRYRDRTDWWNYILQTPAPRFVVACDIDDRPGTGAFVGEVHANVLKALGCVGYATNGSLRDLPAFGAIGFQCFASTVAVSHAFVHIVDFGEPIEIAGLPVSTGDLLFGDRHGLQSIPHALVERIPEAALRMAAVEQDVIRLCQSPVFSIDKLRHLLRSVE